MRQAALAALALALLMGGLCSAQDEYDIKVYPCARAYGPITVDGRLDEPSWQMAPLVGGFTHYNRPELVVPQAFFRVIYGQKYLYFGITCDEPDMKKVMPVAQARDAHAVFSGETIELFIDPKHTHDDYYQFAANIAASLYDSRVQEPYWNADIRAATQLHDDQWTLEFAVAWEDLGVSPEPGTVIGFNICRDRQVSNARQWSNWSQTKANFHDPLRFAHLVISPTAHQLGQLGSEFREGGRAGRIVIYSRNGFSDTTYRSLARRALEQLNVMLADLAKTRDAEGDEKTREAITKLLASHRAELVPFQAAIDGKTDIDAAEWVRMDLRINQLTRELDATIWKARLSALLSGI